MMNQNFGFPPRGNRMPAHPVHPGGRPPHGRLPDGGPHDEGYPRPGFPAPPPPPPPPQPRTPQGHSGCGCGMNRQRTEAVQNRNGGRGCHSDGDSTCKRLLDQLRAVDFALWETVLYLDVYPHSCDALETYHKLQAQSEALRREYEAACGPITATGNQSVTSWDWMSKPFPWEYDAD